MLEQKSINDRTISNYNEFKVAYLQQYSERGEVFLQNLQKKEPWSVKISVQDLIDTFNQLPDVCKKPFDEHDAQLIVQLIKLLAYLPFIDSVVALAYLGFENEEYGLAIYELAYECAYHETPCTNANILMQRAAVINRLATLQIIEGRKI